MLVVNLHSVTPCHHFLLECELQLGSPSASVQFTVAVGITITFHRGTLGVPSPLPLGSTVAVDEALPRNLQILIEIHRGALGVLT